MLWIFLGLIIGGGWAYLAMHSAVFAAPLDAVSGSLGRLGQQGVHALLHAGGVHADSQLTNVVAALAAVLLPGLACLIVAEAVGATKQVKSFAGLLLIGVAVLSFGVLPGGQALLLLAAALVVVVVLAVGRGVLMVLPAMTAVAAFGGRILTGLFTGGHSLTPAVATLTTLGGDASLWRLGLAVVAAVPVVAAVFMSLRSR